MTHKTITFIGAGNMGSALIEKLVQSGYPPSCIWATSPEITKLNSLKAHFGIYITEDNLEGASHADVLVLAVKPQILPAVLTPMSQIIKKRKFLVISIAAGTKESSLRKMTTPETAIVRAMPNTPALIGMGTTALYGNEWVSPEQKQQATFIFEAVGTALWLEDETIMDTITALSGSGPAYFFLFMEALQEAAIKLGLPESMAKQLVQQTALGSVNMSSISDKEISDLRSQVTSPGGGTERALQVLESGHFKELVFKAVAAAKQRYHELGG